MGEDLIGKASAQVAKAQALKSALADKFHNIIASYALPQFEHRMA